MSVRSSLRWCCAYTNYGQETRAAGSLENDKGFSTYLPRLCTQTAVKGVVTAKWEIMFPRYVFVELDLSKEGWQEAQWAKGVARLVGMPTSASAWSDSELLPSALPFGAMTTLRRACGDDRAEILEFPVQVDPVKKGDLVRLNEGPFAQFEGICQLAKDERVVVMLNVFGKRTKATLPASGVERIAL